MPGKMTRSAPLPPFELPEVRAVVRATRLSCQNAGKAKKFTPVRVHLENLGWMRSWRLRKASMIEFIPSPTIPKTCVAPQSIKVSMRMSDVFSSSLRAGAGCAAIASSVSEGAAARVWADVSAARPVIAVPCRKSRRKNPDPLDVAHVDSSARRLNARHMSQVHRLRASKGRLERCRRAARSR